jgi:splicing suppressor protein 51
MIGRQQPCNFVSFLDQSIEASHHPGKSFAMPEKCKQRERILASGSVDVPALPLGAVRGHLCFRCFERSDKILKCAGCRRAGYCSQECQKLDWSATHKKQCKILKRINEEDLKDYSDSRTWAEYRRCLVNMYLKTNAEPNAK